METECFILSVENFQSSKFHKNGAKHGNRNFNRGLTVTFEVINSQNYWKNWVKILQAYLMLVNNQSIYNFSGIQVK